MGAPTTSIYELYINQLDSEILTLKEYYSWIKSKEASEAELAEITGQIFGLKKARQLFLNGYFNGH